MANPRSVTLRSTPVVLADGDGDAKLLRIQVIPIGLGVDHALFGRIDFTPEMAASLVENFKRYEDPIPVDYDHGTNDPQSPEQGAAAGWLKAVKVEGDAVIAYADPTPRGRAYVESGEYRLSSATFDANWTDPKTGESWGPTLLALALTNRPFVRGMDAASVVDAANVALRDQRAQEAGKMADNNGSGTVSLAEHQAKITELQAKLTTAEASLSEAKAKHDAVEKAKADGETALSQAKGRVEVLEKETVSLNAKIKSLSDDLAKKDEEIKKLSDDAANGEAEKKVDALIAEGKLAPAERDAMLELCKKDPEMFTKLTALRSPMPQLSQGKGTDGGGKNVSASDRLDAAVKEKAEALRKERPSLSDAQARVIALRDPEVAKLYGAAEAEKSKQK